MSSPPSAGRSRGALPGGIEDLAPHESVITAGPQEAVDAHVADPAEVRIRWLLAHRLEPVARSADGWEWLYRDPRDGRLWELSFPWSSIHGPGARRLAAIPVEAARARYGRVEAAGDG